MPPIRKARRPESSVEPRSLVIGALMLAGAYLGLAYGPPYLEYYHVREAVREVAERCVMSGPNDGEKQGRCALQIRAAVVEILGHDDPDLVADLVMRPNDTVEGVCDYNRVVKPLGLSARTLHFHASVVAAPAYRGFTSRPAP